MNIEYFYCILTVHLEQVQKFQTFPPSFVFLSTVNPENFWWSDSVLTIFYGKFKMNLRNFESFLNVSCIILTYKNYSRKKSKINSTKKIAKIWQTGGQNFFCIIFDGFLTGPAVSRTIFDCTFVISSTYSRVLTNVIHIFFDLKKLQPRKIQKYGEKKISVSGGEVHWVKFFISQPLSRIP